MKYVSHDYKTTAYMQLYDQLKKDIVIGNLPYASKLPSKRILAADAGVSVITVEHAYALLIEEGYVESRQRSGYYVVFRDDVFGAVQQEKLHRERKYPAPPASFEFPFSIMAKSMRKLIAEYGELLFERSPNLGCDILRRAIKEYLILSRGIITDESQIVIGSGAEYLYSILVELLGRERKFAIESPSYRKIEQVYQLSGANYEALPLGKDGIESSALWNSTANSIHVSPYRSFPSGITASASKRHEYVRWAKQTGGIIIEDDFESEFSVSGKIEKSLFSMTEDDNVIYINSFTKTISPSMRVAYMLLPKHLVDVYEKRVGFLSCTVPTYMQYLLAELISNGDFLRHINRVRRQKRKQLQQINDSSNE